jgi:hypothetical protein
MNFTDASSTDPICYLVVEVEAGESALNLDATDTSHADSIRLAGIACHPPLFKDTGRKPRLDHDHAIWH